MATASTLITSIVTEGGSYTGTSPTVAQVTDSSDATYWQTLTNPSTATIDGAFAIPADYDSLNTSGLSVTIRTQLGNTLTDDSYDCTFTLRDSGGTSVDSFTPALQEFSADSTWYDFTFTCSSGFAPTAAELATYSWWLSAVFSKIKGGDGVVIRTAQIDFDWDYTPTSSGVSVAGTAALSIASSATVGVTKNIAGTATLSVAATGTATTTKYVAGSATLSLAATATATSAKTHSVAGSATLSLAASATATSAATGNFTEIWNGSTWTTGVVEIYNGSTWVEAVVEVHDGAGWV